MSWETAISLQQVVLPTPMRDMLFSLCGSMPLTGMGESIPWYQVHIDDTSVKVGGIQQQKMNDNFVISLNIQHGSPLHMVKGWNGILHIHAPCKDDGDTSILDWLCTILQSRLM